MKRRFSALVLFVSLLLISQVALSVHLHDVTAVVETANAITEAMIENATFAVLKLNGNAKGCNTAINAIGESLVLKASQVSHSMIRICERYGMVVECFHVKVVLSNQIFLVDPLRVIDD